MENRTHVGVRVIMMTIRVAKATSDRHHNTNPESARDEEMITVSSQGFILNRDVIKLVIYGN